MVRDWVVLCSVFTYSIFIFLFHHLVLVLISLGSYCGRFTANSPLTTTAAHGVICGAVNSSSSH